MQSVAEIEQFILDAGSDDLNTFGGKFQGGVHSQQVPNELARCIYEIMQSGEKITSYLELGVAAGGTTFIVNHFFKPRNIVLVDINEHPKSGMRPEVLKGIDYEEIIGDSQAESSIEKAEDLGPYNLMLIDGVHQNPWARNDVFFYSSMLVPGGFLALHDSSWAQGDVGAVVEELKQGKGFEFINEFVCREDRQIICGIALFRKAR